MYNIRNTIRETNMFFHIIKLTRIFKTCLIFLTGINLFNKYDFEEHKKAKKFIEQYNSKVESYNNTINKDIL
jgi:hypothetical protein